jgi:BTB/POZ domain
LVVAKQQQEPLIYLPKARLSSLQSLLDFMYSGEVSVSQQELGSFLNLAEDLRIKGLTPQTEHNSSTASAHNSTASSAHNQPQEQSSGGSATIVLATL